MAASDGSSVYDIPLSELEKMTPDDFKNLMPRRYIPEVFGSLNGFQIMRPRFSSSGLEIEIHHGISYTKRDYAQFFPSDNKEGERKVRLNTVIDNGYIGFQKSNHDYSHFFQNENGIWVNKGPVHPSAPFAFAGERYFSQRYAPNSLEHRAFQTLIEFSGR